MKLVEITKLWLSLDSEQSYSEQLGPKEISKPRNIYVHISSHI